MQIILILFFFLTISENSLLQTHSPVKAKLTDIKLSHIGQFGLLRKPRPGIPAHFHTGVDIKRPSDNYLDEPIFPITSGKVISIRRDGPYANLIVEHKYKGIKFWSIYEHISGIIVNLNDSVIPDQPIAHFMNKSELDRYGWQFDHFHLEILRVQPIKLEPDDKYPDLYYKAYSLSCYSDEDLQNYYYDPIEFLQSFPEILDK